MIGHGALAAVIAPHGRLILARSKRAGGSESRLLSLDPRDAGIGCCPEFRSVAVHGEIGPGDMDSIPLEPAADVGEVVADGASDADGGDAAA